MTEELFTLLNKEASPFNGQMVNSCEDTSIENLKRVFNYFYENFHDTDQIIYTFDCWHEHDGFITNKSEISWQELTKIFANENSLRSFSITDEEVRKTIFSKSHKWLFRWCLDEEDHAYNDFEACFSNELTEHSSMLLKELKEGIAIQNTLEYFKSSYGG